MFLQWYKTTKVLSENLRCMDLLFHMHIHTHCSVMHFVLSPFSIFSYLIIQIGTAEIGSDDVLGNMD